MKHNYLVSVFVGGKNVLLFFSKDLDDLVTIKALHKDCEIYISDLDNFVQLTKEQVEREIIRSGKRWKASLNKQKFEESTSPNPAEEQKNEKMKKYWERPVLCVETGQLFSSIRECSDKLGIPYTTIANCIKNGNATRGVHFTTGQK